LRWWLPFTPPAGCSFTILALPSSFVSHSTTLRRGTGRRSKRPKRFNVPGILQSFHAYFGRVHDRASIVNVLRAPALLLSATNFLIAVRPRGSGWREKAHHLGSVTAISSADGKIPSAHVKDYQPGEDCDNFRNHEFPRLDSRLQIIQRGWQTKEVSADWDFSIVWQLAIPDYLVGYLAGSRARWRAHPRNLLVVTLKRWLQTPPSPVPI
jgi:hypothetical protein